MGTRFLLKSTALIYTGADKKEEIDAILAQSEFQPYLERIRMVEKGAEDSIVKILHEINSRFESHFAFKFGQELKFNAVKALDSILVDIGKMSFDEFVWTFGHKREQNNRSISINEFIEILSEKFRNNLANEDWSKTVFESSEPADVSVEMVRKLWSYRLYRFPSDDLVRVGDIIAKEGGSNDEKFLVISSDCHMNQFWKKNFGSLTLIPLYANSTTSNNFQDKLLTSKNRGDIRRNVKVTSITNLNGFDSLTLITSIPSSDIDGNVVFTDYVAFPRSVFSIDVPKPEIEENRIRVQELLYSHMEGFTGRDRLSINEPFRSPLIQYCVNAITGYGAPDYPIELQNSIQTRFDENFTV